MQRRFLQDFGTFRKGDVRDYPRATWEQIATTAKVTMEKLAEPVVEAAKFHPLARPAKAKGKTA